jgi:hypothetical protein
MPDTPAPSQLLWLECPFESALNPKAEEAEAHAVQWALSMRIIETTAAEQRFRRARFPLLIARAYPFSPLEPLNVVVDWNCWLFLWDDQCDEGQLGREPDRLAAAHARYIEILHGSEASARDMRMSFALEDIRNRMLAMRRGPWFDRFVRSVHQYFDACVWEATNRKNGTIPGVDQYIEKRLASGAVYTDVELFELSDDVVLPDDVRSSEIIQELTRIANDVVCWSNDIVSHRKEMLRGDVHNLVLVLQHERKIPLPEAIQRAAAMNAAEMQRFISWEQRLPRYEPDIQRNVERYVRLLRAWMRGNIDWALGSRRYKLGSDV